jgi:hypothetical protein
MKNKLRFKLCSAPNPYSNEHCSNTEKWGCLSIVLLKSNEEIDLLRTQWDMSLLINWFFENQVFLKNESLLVLDKIVLIQRESLAHCIQRLLDQNFSEEQEEEQEQWYEEIFNFRQRHALRSALRGANIPDIFIGTNYGQGEISLSTQNEIWSYSFDIDDFLADFCKRAEIFLHSGLIDS